MEREASLIKVLSYSDSEKKKVVRGKRARGCILGVLNSLDASILI